MGNHIIDDRRQMIGFFSVVCIPVCVLSRTWRGSGLVSTGHTSLPRIFCKSLHASVFIIHILVWGSSFSPHIIPTAGATPTGSFSIDQLRSLPHNHKSRQCVISDHSCRARRTSIRRKKDYVTPVCPFPTAVRRNPSPPLTHSGETPSFTPSKYAFLHMYANGWTWVPAPPDVLPKK